MHDAEVTDVVRDNRHRPKRAFDPSPFRSLFLMFRSLRAAGVEALHELFFKHAFRDQSIRTTRRMVAELVDNGYLARMRLPHGRIICHLTRRSLAVFEAAGISAPETIRRAPTVEVGGYLWLRANLRAEHVRAGFNVGRGPPAAYALRRFLLDSAPCSPRVSAAVRANPMLSPVIVAGCRCGFRADIGMPVTTCPRCHRAAKPSPVHAIFECVGCQAARTKPGAHDGCSALVREVDGLPVDLAWRKVDGRYDVRLIVVDHPTRGLGAQLAELPLKHVGAPKIPVVVRSTDPDSRYDRKRHEWAVKGPRQQQLERTFTERCFDAALPFAETATLIDVLPDLQLHILRSGAPAPAWDCAPPWNGGRAKSSRKREQERPREIERDEEMARHIDFAALRRIAERERERDEPERVAPAGERIAVARESASGARFDERSSGGFVRRR